MIKGIYNENEFYTNFYWDTKLLEDMRSKAPAGAEEKVNQLKALDSLFWKLKDSVSSHGANQGQQIEFYNLLFQILGFQPVQESTQTSESGHYTRFLNENKDSNPELIGILTSEIETGSFEAAPLYLTDKIEGEQSVFELDLKELLREELLDSQAPPRWVLVGSPNSLFIIERTKWALGRYIRIEWQEVFLQRDSKPYELLLGLCSKSALCPDSGSSNHDEFDDNSHRHAFEVTTELRESVREAIEALINELIDLRKESHQKIYAKESSDLYAKELTHDALYYVYRLLFLLYLEAQGEDSDLLPLKSEIYRNGYSLEKLLELDFVEVAPDSPEAKGTFIFESLEQIFNLIFYGFEPGVKDGLLKSDLSATGFLVKGIKSDLFDPNAMKHLKGVKLSNGALLDILKKLSLTRKKERGNKPRSRVSYANLGINQLGAVYEGLLSYTGFFAQEDLHALKPEGVKQSDIDRGKELDQVYLAPKSLVDKYRRTREEKYKLNDENTLLDIDGNPKVYKKGSFIYRLAGRDRQRLASYYTPESLTKSAVKYSLKVLCENKKTLDELLEVKILEPAMGSGAFLNEAVNQLADKILELEVQNKVGDLSSPKAKKRRLWSIKYKLIAENVYGVDLNPTAVELARFSLWLNCIGAGKEPPNFDGRLKIGNSLVGAEIKKSADGAYSFLLMHDKMLSFSTKLRAYSEPMFIAAKQMRSSLLQSRLSSSAQQVSEVQSGIERLILDLRSSDKVKSSTAYSRLKRICDYWCSLFFFKQEALSALPKTHEEYLRHLSEITEGNEDFGSVQLRRFIDETAIEERFFHWGLEYPVLAESGFDLILGNPPWVAIEWHEAQQVEDFFPLPAIRELDAKAAQELTSQNFTLEEKHEVARRLIRYEGYSNILETERFKILSGVSKNTYKFFIPIAFSLCSEGGAIGLIHEDGIYEDLKSDNLRSILYKRLRFHFHFVNQKGLFEIGNTRSYSINICGPATTATHFIHIGNLFLPSTIDACLDAPSSDGRKTPGIKNLNDEWDVSGHANRIIRVNAEILSVFSGLANVTSESPPLFNLHSNSLLRFLTVLQRPSRRVGTLLGENAVGGGMFEAKSAQRDGLIVQNNAVASHTGDIVLSAPHICRGTMYGQQTKERYDNHRSYESVDLTTITNNWQPRVLFHHGPGSIDQHLHTYSLAGRHYRQFFRLAYRRRFDVQSERCFYSCIIPPGVSHIDLIESIACTDTYAMVVIAGYCMSICYDSIARIKNLKDCRYNELREFPIGPNDQFHGSIARRVLFLSSLKSDFDLLEEELIHLNVQDSLSNGLELPTDRAQRRTLATRDDIRNLVVTEIDALVAISLGVDPDMFEGIYGTLMPVLAMYDREDHFQRINHFNTSRSFFIERGW